MKHQFGKRLLSSLLVGTLLLTGIPTLAQAANAADTISGEAETIAVSSSVEAVRESNFDEGWKFYLGTSSTAQNVNFDDSSWKSITLPHDFSISQTFTTSGEAESGFLPGGTGWYRKTFTLPESYAGKTLVLNFDGAYADAYVYVNGTMLGENHYGYTSFAFDITDYVTCDGATENVVAVKVVNNIPSSRWYSGSGIYRDVTLIATDPVHVARYGTHVTTPNIASGNGTVNVEVEVSNDSNASVDVTVTNTVIETGDTANTTVTVGAGASVTATANPVVSNPDLWSIDSPNLYTVRTELSVSGQVVDTYDTTFGFRYFSFDSTGFHLNGENVKINGVCLHDDQGALGSAAYYDAMYRQLTIMKDMGVNAVRTSHNPHDRQFMEICNELGLLVVEDCFDAWLACRNGNTYDISYWFDTNLTSSNQVIGGSTSMNWGEFAMRSMVLRDRNDPCLIMWSLANEVQEGTSGATTAFVDVADMLLGVMNELDGTRPATMSDNTAGSNSVLATIVSHVMDKTLNPSGGVVGYNYASGSTLDSQHNTYDVIVSSETSSAVNSRSQYKSQANAAAVDGNYHLTSYDTSTVSWGMTAHDSIYTTMTRDFVAGEFVWTGFDYIGEPTPWNGTGTGSVSGAGAVPNSSYFGIVETTGFEKDTYYLYRSQWNRDETTLHLVTAWDSDNMMFTSGKTPVVIYSNAPVVKLYRNGTLIGTATRQVNTTSAGYTYYTYTTTSNDSSVCTAVSGSNGTSLYATFNVTYASGTISAKAFEADGTTEIALTGNSGKNSVSTPGTVSQLVVSQNKTEIAADGSSLVYITVDVTDANDVLDTTATNTINFSLTGNGEILGVDNGDQAITAKYQQSSVLTSTTSAKIAAYAGKALVIVRSTKDAGSFTVNVTSSGLTGGSAIVTTTAVDDGAVQEGLVSYTMVRDYSVKAGTVPTLQTTATGTMADGSTVNGTIAWDAITEATYNAAGDYTINGTLTFAGEEPIAVTARLHVIDNVIALRNISTVTTPNTVPTLPTVVSGVLADGTLSGEFTVTWDAMTADQFATVGDIVTVNGTAAIFGEETLPVTCTVRVGEAVNTESTNIASQYLSLTEDCSNPSDNLLSIVDGSTGYADATNMRWTNWNDRNTSSTAAITFTWATAHLISSVNLYFFTDSYSAALPAAVKFEYSLNGVDFTEIGYEDVTPTAAFTKTEYVFDQVINPVALRITLTEQSGHCVGLTEAEIMTFAGKLEYNSSADLSGITVDGTAIDGFAADTLTYTASGSAVAATTDVNAGITVLPALDNVVRILTVSEDGSTSRTYEITLDSSTPACAHERTEIRNAKGAACTEDGYTGDTYCTDCGELLKSGTAIPALGHDTVLQNAKEATCTEEGYTGDVYCNREQVVIGTGTVIPATGHKWDNGVVTKEATEEEEGVMTYTCTVCDETKTESIPKVPAQLLVPSVSVSAAKAASGTKITLTGTFEDYENLSKYYTVTAHGLVYYSTTKLGTKILTVNTAGRTKVSFSSYKDDGSFSYTMTPAFATTRYTVRAFLAYTDANGRTMYAYSAPIVVSYNGLQ